MGSEAELLKALAALKQKEEENLASKFLKQIYPSQWDFLNSTANTSCLIGGNRVGKTLTGSFGIKCHATGDYPPEWRGVRFAGPIDIWVAGVTAQRVRDTVQEKLFGKLGRMGTGMIPKSAIMVDSILKKTGTPGAIDRIDIKHVSGGMSTIQFFSYEMDREKFQGSSVQLCVAEDELVLMSDLTYRKIQDVLVGDTVLSLDGEGKLVPRTVLGVHARGEKDTIRVEMKRGGFLDCTPDHELYCSLKKKVEARNATHVVTIPLGYENASPIDRDLCWYAWAGLVLSEGTVKSKKITMGDSVAVREAISLLPPNTYVRKKDMSKFNHVPDWFLNWDEFWEEFPEGLSHQKEIPEWVFRSSNNMIIQTLRFMYSGDGWFNNKSIGYATTSRLMAQQVCNLLWRLGIRSSLYFKKKQNEKWRDQYFVLITKAEDSMRFLEMIRVPGKEDAAAKTRTEVIRRLSSCDKRNAEAMQRHIDAGHNIGGCRHEPKYLKTAIRKLTPVGTKRTYDLSVSGEHRFIVNNALISNCWFDEEPPEPIYNECKMRVLDCSGNIFFTFTPLSGITTLYDNIMQDDKIHKVWLSMDDAKHLKAEDIDRLLEGMSDSEKKARRHGVATIGAGKVFNFEEGEYSIEPFDIPPYWRRIGGLDVGLTHPTGALMAALDDDSGTIYITNEYRVSNKTAIDHAAHLKHWGVKFMTDPHAFDRMIGTGTSTASIYADEGLTLLKANNNVDASITEIRKLIGSGRLYIFNTCQMLLKEMRTYRTKETSDGNTKIVKVDDDLIDPMRYLLMGIEENAEVPKRFRRRPNMKQFRPADKKVAY